MNDVKVFAQLPEKQVLIQPQWKKQQQNDCQSVLGLYFWQAVTFHLWSQCQNKFMIAFSGVSHFLSAIETHKVEG